MVSCNDVFFNTYKREPDGIAFCPYRICPIGAHTDHQLGKITGMAINAGVRIAFGAKQNGVVELSSLQFDKRGQWHVLNVPDTKQNDWADYLRGATLALSEKYSIRIGMVGVVEGSLPIGGLSSSAAVIIAFLKALCTVNGISLSDRETIEIALNAENKYVGVSCGKLDQSCEVYSRKNHLLYMDLKDDTYELIKTPDTMKQYKIAIIFSGVERTLVGSAFNMRVDECKSAAYALKAYAGMDYGKFADTYLRDVPRDVFERYKDRLPESWRLRAEHWYNEYDRVHFGVEAWKNGDIEEFGRLSFQSGSSSINYWQTGSPELISLYEIMTQTDGIYGGRFSGAGFKGCCMALIDPSFEDSIRARITDEYLKKFPLLKDSFSLHFCESADGVSIN